MWFKAVFVVVAAVVAAVVVCCEAAVPPAGKCRNDISPVPIAFNTVRIVYKKWKILYVPDSEEFSSVDSESRKIISTSPNFMVVSDKVVGKSGTKYPYPFVLTYGDDLILYEESTGHENGEIFYFKWFPIAVTSEGGILYYRCSDTNATQSIDTRFFVIPSRNEFPPADEQYILDADKKINFEGGIRKLDNKFQ